MTAIFERDGEPISGIEVSGFLDRTTEAIDESSDITPLVREQDGDFMPSTFR